MENANNAPITISAVVSRSARCETSRTGLPVGRQTAHDREPAAWNFLGRRRLAGRPRASTGFGRWRRGIALLPEQRRQGGEKDIDTGFYFPEPGVGV